MHILLIYTKYQSISLIIYKNILQTRKKGKKNISFQYEVNHLKIFVVCPPDLLLAQK